VRFLADVPGEAPVMTGHANGVITLNLAEADDAERERRRVQLFEPQRTLVGHFRHESGHYYWSVLIAGSPWHERVRALFGDERANYAAALAAYYATARRRPGRTSASPPMPARIPGRIGRRRGRTSCT
jgi:hypothetical protein